MIHEALDTANGVFLCSDRDRCELTEFQRRNEAPDSPALDPDRRSWLFSGGPSTFARGSTVWIARRHGTIVGTEAGIPFPLMVEGTAYRGSWAVDLMVDPEWRGKGIGASLSVAHRASCEVSGFLNISDAGQRLLQRRKAVDLGTVVMYVRPVAGRGLLGWEHVRRTPRTAMLGATVPVLGWVDRITRIGNDGVELLPVEAFDDRSDALWDSVSSHYPVATRRDTSWLRWRFDECPEPHRYRRYYIACSGRLIGHVVLRTTTWGGGVALDVVDYLAAPKDTAHVFRCCVDVARAAGVVAVVCRTLNSQASSALRANGFIPGRNGRVRFSCYSNDPRVSSVIRDRSRWLVTSADSDLD